MKELTIDAAIENIATVTEFVDAQLKDIGCSVKAQMQIDVAIDELFGNIARYAYHPQTGPATVGIEVVESPRTVEITLIDHGIPYNPLEQEEPDISLSAEERAAGGLGIYLVKKIMDEVSYEYQGGQNILRMKKIV